MSQPTPYEVLRGPVDLTACDLEPVHQIGTVQSHGALLIFDAGNGELRETSSNWRDLLPSRDGVTVADLFDADVAAKLQQVEISDRTVVLAHPLANGCEVSAHRAKGHLVVELEWTDAARPLDPTDCLNSVMRGVSREQTSAGYLTALAQNLQSCLQIDRVMIYRFLPDWAGEVVAEASADTVDYLGLRFPSTDIPEPARNVFERVWVRHIADIAQPALPVTGASNELSLLDFTQVGIRAASPIHLEYLANMGVQASLTLSLRVGDRLWGLVACHHRSPYLLRPSARASLEILAQMSSFQLAALIAEETQGERNQAEAELAALEALLEANDDPVLGRHLHELETFIASDVAAVYENGRWSRRAGISLEVLDNFRSWLLKERQDELALYHRADLPPALVPHYAGALVIAPAGRHGRLVCWFRHEQAQSVRWAGRPDKLPVAGRLHPRASFAEYVEKTVGKSLPWSELDLWKANRMATMLRALSLRMHRRLEQKNEALSRSNRELDSFAYMASHDLKEPLRGIHNYATFLYEDYGDQLEGEGKMFIEGLKTLSTRMSILLDSLLAYSRLNNQTLDVKDCDLHALAQEACRLLKITRGVEPEILGTLPVVQAYPPFLSEIVVNLLSNAIKYSNDDNRVVQIGSQGQTAQHDVFYVRDNGIGIPAEFHEDIFHLFRRLHGEGERGDGAGVGLTIVRRMVERHGGQIWLESELGKGTTFFVALPRLHPETQN